MEEDIFSENNKLSGRWVKFKEINDKFKGTYIGNRMQTNTLSGKKQKVYEFIDDTKALCFVGGKPGIDMQMDHVTFGQIVGFKFVEVRKNKNPGLNDIKVIQVYASPGLVNEEWIEEQKKKAELFKKIDQHEEPVEDVASSETPAQEPTQASANDTATPTDATPATSTTTANATPATVDDKIVMIMGLAKRAWQIEDPEAVKTKVMEYTNLPFIETNLDKIIEKLK